MRTTDRFPNRPVVLIDGQPEEEATILKAYRKTQPTRPLVALPSADPVALEALGESLAKKPLLAVLDAELTIKEGADVLLERTMKVAGLKSVPKVLLVPEDGEDLSIKESRLLEKGAQSVLVKPKQLEELERVAERMFRYWLEVNEAVA